MWSVSARTRQAHWIGVSGVMCSTSACEHCWPIEGWIHSQRRNRLDQKLVEKLVRTHTNLVLRESLDDTLRDLMITMGHRACHRWARWWERRGTGSLSLSVDCCYSNLLDLLRVKTRVCSYNLYATPFLSFPSHLTLVKLIKLKRTQSVCTEKERKRERKRGKTERKQSFFLFFGPMGIGGRMGVPPSDGYRWLEPHIRRPSSRRMGWTDEDVQNPHPSSEKKTPAKKIKKIKKCPGSRAQRGGALVSCPGNQEGSHLR